MIVNNWSNNGKKDKIKEYNKKENTIKKENTLKDILS